MLLNKTVKKGFMNAIKDYEDIVGNTLEDSGKYTMSDICSVEVDYFDSYFSNGFMNAIEEGRLPILGTEIKVDDWNKRHGGKEYHHFIYNDECYVVFFEEE